MKKIILSLIITISSQLILSSQNNQAGAAAAAAADSASDIEKARKMWQDFKANHPNYRPEKPQPISVDRNNPTMQAARLLHSNGGQKPE